MEMVVVIQIHLFNNIHKIISSHKSLLSYLNLEDDEESIISIFIIEKINYPLSVEDRESNDNSMIWDQS